MSEEDFLEVLDELRALLERGAVAEALERIDDVSDEVEEEIEGDEEAEDDADEESDEEAEQPEEQSIWR